MSLDLYATEYRTPLADNVFRSLLAQLPIALQQKVTRFRNWEDQHAALLGKMLLRRALQNAGYDPDLSLLRYTAEQKPFLPEGPSFNLSHSGNRVLCLLGGHEPLGIDIETVSPLQIEDFQPQFTAGEWARMHATPSPLHSFYRFWTAKESLLKADGRGLGIPLLSIDLSHSMTVTLDNTTWTVHELPLFDGYACAWCTICQDPPPAIRYHEIGINEF